MIGLKDIHRFWADCCFANSIEKTTFKEAFQFGASPDWLAELVLTGKKTATTSGLFFYEEENEPLPQIGDYSIVLNSNDEPIAVIQVQVVEVIPMNRVTPEFVQLEGEGDYLYWWDSHKAFFTKELHEYNQTFSPDMLVVCEQFRKIYSKE